MRITKAIFLSLILIFFISIGAKAQIANVEGVGGQPLSVKKYNKVQGTPYYFGANKWYNSTIYLADGNQRNNVSVRYNGFADELEYERDGKILVIDNYNIKGFDFYVRDNITGERTKYEFRNGFSVPGEIDKKQFFNVIYAGEKLSLLEKIYVIESTVTPAVYGEQPYTKFVSTEKTILVSSDDARDFKIKKRSFYDISPNNKAKIKSYINDMDLDLNENQDVAQLLSFIETEVL